VFAYASMVEILVVQGSVH